MAATSEKILVTSALPYANGPLHLGHLAGAYIPADVYVRYQRLKGADVLFVGGSDEHGVPITIRADREGITPQAVVDRYHAAMQRTFERIGVKFDNYSRTSLPLHHKISQDFFLRLNEKGFIRDEEVRQYYCVECHRFLPDRYIEGECPHCHSLGARGDQCEACGRWLEPEQLLQPKCKVCNAAPELRVTKHWYFKLSAFQKQLEDWQAGKYEWKNNVREFSSGWFKEGLTDRPITRDIDWGIPVPLPDAEGKVLYVWFDAPIGYISATKELTPEWEKYWKSEDTKMVHFIGKDNIVFHCIVFPSMLHGHGGFVLPENVPANEFLNLEGDKISTSRNWAVWLHEYLAEFPGKEDVLRYVLCANAPETKDNDFTWRDFQARNNNELVAVLGNFVNRALVLTDKYFDGKVPAAGALTDYDRDTLAELPSIRRSLEENVEHFRFREALKDAMNIARLGNKYLADTEPWKVIKDDPERVATILNVSLQITANLAIAIEPFMPFTSEKILAMLAVPRLGWERLSSTDLMMPGHSIGKAELLFEKIEDKVIEAQIEKLAETKKANIALSAAKEVEAQKESISFDDFGRMDIRVATVLEAVKVDKTKKLLKLTIDTGIDKRTIVSGIAEYYSPEELVGRQVLVLVNLEPRELKGVLSQGMILMASDASGKLVLVSPTDKVINGTQIG